MQFSSALVGGYHSFYHWVLWGDRVVSNANTIVRYNKSQSWKFSWGFSNVARVSFSQLPAPRTLGLVPLNAGRGKCDGATSCSYGLFCVRRYQVARAAAVPASHTRAWIWFPQRLRVKCCGSVRSGCSPKGGVREGGLVILRLHFVCVSRFPDDLAAFFRVSQSCLRKREWRVRSGTSPSRSPLTMWLGMATR